MKKGFNKLTHNQQKAMILAMAVRNAVEDFHGGGTPETIKNTNEYMKEFNTILRDTIYATLNGIDGGLESVEASIMCIPDYWEVPKTPEGIVALRKRVKNETI